MRDGLHFLWERFSSQMAGVQTFVYQALLTETEQSIMSEENNLLQVK